jgi:hypothetical protein
MKDDLTIACAKLLLVYQETLGRLYQLAVDNEDEFADGCHSHYYKKLEEEKKKLIDMLEEEIQAIDLIARH